MKREYRAWKCARHVLVQRHSTSYFMGESDECPSEKLPPTVLAHLVFVPWGPGLKPLRQETLISKRRQWRSSPTVFGLHLRFWRKPHCPARTTPAPRGSENAGTKSNPILLPGLIPPRVNRLYPRATTIVIYRDERTCRPGRNGTLANNTGLLIATVA